MKRERSISIYPVILFIVIFILLFSFVIFGDVKLHGFSSEGQTPSSVRIGGPIVLSVCGNGTVERPYEECDDGNTISGDGCSATCQNEGEEEPPSPPEEPPTEAGISLTIDPTEIKRDMLVSSNIEETIGIINRDAKTKINFSVSSTDFDPNFIVLFWDVKQRQWVRSFTLSMDGGEIYSLRTRLSSPAESGIYNGLIRIDGRTVNVSINVQDKLLLFDSNIIVLNDNYLVPRGDNLRTSVTLIPLGDKERMDVTLNYIIKDYNGKAYLTRSETVLIENQITFKRNFDTGVLPLGQYIVALELIYPNGVAPSSAHFEVTTARQNTFFGKVVFFIINLILIILILIIILIAMKIIKDVRKKRDKEENEKVIKEIKEKERILDK